MTNIEYMLLAATTDIDHPKLRRIMGAVQYNEFSNMARRELATNSDCWFVGMQEVTPGNVVRLVFVFDKSNSEAEGGWLEWVEILKKGGVKLTHHPSLDKDLWGFIPET